MKGGDALCRSIKAQPDADAKKTLYAITISKNGGTRHPPIYSHP